MNFKIPHKTTTFKAVQKVKDALENARPQLKGQATIEEETWAKNTLTFRVNIQGKTVTGSLEVTDTHFLVNAKLPLLWRLFEGRIEKMIMEQVKQLQ